MSYKVVIVDSEYADTAVEAQALAPDGAELVRFQAFTEDELIEATRDADAVLNQYAKITARVLEAMPRCKGVVRYGVGFDNVDIEAAARCGIYVCNVPDYCEEEVASHALAMMLALHRRIPVLDAAIRRSAWDNRLLPPIPALGGSTLGLLGFGRIARKLARMVAGLELRLVAHDPYVTQDQAEPYGVALVDREELFRQSDLVSIHLPLNDQTRGCVNLDVLRLMKPTAYVVNTSRGGVIDEDDLVAALGQGLIGGAGLDTFANEPIDGTHPVLRFPNVVVTSHASWYSDRSEVELRRRAAEEAGRLGRGDPPKNPVNKPCR